ncbi:MAG: amidase [Betaproteobacteria bacterium]|nr:amidase [Betaproteobacteria bacterium]
MTAPNRLSATEALARMRAGTLSAEALMAACLDRIRAREPEVRAWVHLEAAATALERARAFDPASMRGALAAIPLGVKDVIDSGDMPTQYNSPFYAAFRPRVDAACVAMARREGAIVVGKTVTTEFASRVPGPTCNPHNPEHTPGGSSSGSAAAVADCMVPIAFGTQTGGSVIRPAAYCGVVGYKPTFGSINCAGMKHLSESLDTIGVLARSVEDCALTVHATSGRLLPDFAAADHAPRIGLCRTSRWDKASHATHAILERAAQTLSQRGAAVREVALASDFDRLYEEQQTMSNFEMARGLAAEWRAHPALLSEHMRRQIELHIDMPRSRYTEAAQHAVQCRSQFARLLAESAVDVLLTPSAPDEAPKGLASTGDSLFNRNWTLLGAPCVTLPAGTGPNGLPIGVQLVGGRDDDERVLLSAYWAQRALS